MSESLDDDDPGLETQPPTNPLPLLPPPFAPAIVSATPADDVESDPDSPVLPRRTYTSSPPDSHTQPQRTSPAADFSDDDDDHLFTQPPTVARSPFVDSARFIIGSESTLNSSFPNEYLAPPPTPSITIPDYISSAITKQLQLTWGCARPCPYQIEAIFHLVFRNTDMMYLIRKTGEGKSLVMQGMASMLKGITISVVPLLGLGSDQADKCNVDSVAIEAYHIDEFRGSHADLLRTHLRKYTRDEKTAIILFLSPQQMDKNSMWYSVLMDLATRGCISAFVIDEVHATVQNYESFRPEFKTAMQTANTIVKAARKSDGNYYVPILAMSATFTIADQQSFNNLIQRQPTIVIWGGMDRRNISFNVNIVGDPLSALVNDWVPIATTQSDSQSLIYSNSAASCDGAILNRLQSVRTKIPFDNGRFMPLTGDCGLMLKAYLMACFCGHTADLADPNALPNIWCMPCTSAANCGVSSTRCTTCFRIGPPPSWHELVQEMGRVDRLQNAEPGSNQYNIYLNLNTYLSLWMRVQLEPNSSVRDRQNNDILSVLRFLILPHECYHSVIESHFEDPTLSTLRDGCENNCSYSFSSFPRSVRHSRR